MSEQTPPAGDQTGGDPNPNPNPNPTPDDAKPASSSRKPVQSTSSDDAGTRHAAYDTRLQRFVGGVHDSAKAARDAAKDRGVKAGDVEVRKV